MYVISLILTRLQINISKGHIMYEFETSSPCTINKKQLTEAVVRYVRMKAYASTKQCFINTFKTHKFIYFIFQMKNPYIVLLFPVRPFGRPIGRQAGRQFNLLLSLLILNLCLGKKHPRLSAFTSPISESTLRSRLSEVSRYMDDIHDIPEMPRIF